MTARTRILLLTAALGAAVMLAALSAGCSQGATAPTNQPPAATPSTPATTPASAPTTPAVTGIALGKMIFDTGAGNSGTIPTKLGFAKVKVNACKNCHGADGKGGKKSLVAGPDIRGAKLQPDFDEAKFARAVTTGVDDAGKPLKSKMPRFSATPEETAALWLYINSLK